MSSSFTRKQRKLKGKPKSSRAVKRHRESRAVTYVPAARSPMEKRYIDCPIGTNGATTVPFSGAVAEGALIDAASTYSQVTTLGSIVPSFNLIPATSSGQGSRTGNKVTVTNLNAQGEFLIQPGSAGQSDQLMRMIWYVDTECSGIAAVPQDILRELFTTNTTSAAASFNAFTYRNYNIANRFRILKDKTYNLSAAAGDGTSGNRRSVPWKISRRMNLEVRYIDDSANLSAVKGNNIGVLFICSSQGTGGVATDADAYVLGVARTKYVG